MHPDEIQSALPPPDDRDPPMLRRDIADELADHMACAVNRERRRTEDEISARRAALDCFGNPAAIARKLYFDAMKETLMKDRILLAAVALLAIVCLTSVALSWSAVSQNRELNRAMLAQLDKLGPVAPAAKDLEWTNLSTAIRVGSDTGPPAEGWTVYMSGPAINFGQNIRLEEKTDSSGIVQFGPVRPGQYQLGGWGEWAGWYRPEVVILPGQTLDFKLVAPPLPEKVSLRPVVDWPQETRPPDRWLAALVERVDEAGEDADGVKWYYVYPKVLLISPEGKLFEHSHQGEPFKFSDAKERDTFTLPRGRYTVRLSAATVGPPAFGPLDSRTQPALPELDLTEGPSKVDWVISVPEQLLE